MYVKNTGKISEIILEKKKHLSDRFINVFCAKLIIYDLFETTSRVRTTRENRGTLQTNTHFNTFRLSSYELLSSSLTCNSRAQEQVNENGS